MWKLFLWIFLQDPNVKCRFQKRQSISEKLNEKCQYRENTN